MASKNHSCFCCFIRYYILLNLMVTKNLQEFLMMMRKVVNIKQFETRIEINNEMKAIMT